VLRRRTSPDTIRAKASWGINLGEGFWDSDFGEASWGINLGEGFWRLGGSQAKKYETVSLPIRCHESARRSA
jgi:hypothetical protein